MNEQQYRKQLLVQQIDAHRGLLRLEVERVKDLNPVRPFMELGHQILDVAGSIRSGGAGSGISAAIQPWKLNLGVVIPFVVRLATRALKRRKKGRAK